MTDESIFATALNITDADRRATFLVAACGGDAERRARVERLLIAHRGATDFLENPPADVDLNAPTRTLDAAAGDEPVAAALALLGPSARPGALGRLGHYDVLEVLGRGGFGVVFRTFDDVLQRVVAIKVLSPQMAATSPARKRFLREARWSARVRHENVVQVYAVEEQPLPFLVMEFIPGETLQQRLGRNGPLAVAEVVRTGREIAQGLAAAHATGLIHRDIKPSNVLIEAGSHERAKLTDFGLARAADDASISQSGLVAGTPMYMSPEQARGDALDHRSDLFSLGSVLYVMCTGRPPFRASGTVAVLRRVCDEDPRPIREVIPEVPGWLCRIVERLHAKNPDDRLQTAQEVADLLTECERRIRENGAPAGALLLLALGAIGAYALTRPSANPGAGTAGTAPPAAAPAVLAPPAAPAVPPAPGGGPPALAPPPRAVPRPEPARAPFDPAEARSHQAAWARYLGREVEFADRTVGTEFRLIPPGEFLMGADPEQVHPQIDRLWNGNAPGKEIAIRALESEKPQRAARITRPFALGKYEVTVAQFAEFVRHTGHTTTAEKDGGAGFDNDGLTAGRNKKYNWREVGYKQTPTCPVWNVSHADAVAFCKWLSATEGHTFRLPTEAEWEWACRGGTATRTFWAKLTPGDADAYAFTALKGGRPPQEVGGLRPNPFGLHDTCGNVWEWCADWFGEKHYAQTAGRGTLIDPKGPDGPDGKRGHRVQRGGGSARGQFAVTSTGRSHQEQELCGFRVLIELEAK